MYTSLFDDLAAADPYNDGRNRRRLAPPPVPRPGATLAERLAAQAAAEQSANAQMAGPVNPAIPGAAVTPTADLTAVLASNPAPPTVNTSSGERTADNQVHVGERFPETLSPLGRKLTEYHARQQAGVSSKVTETPWGYEEQPPPAHGPSRKMKALEGFLTGGAIAAASGPTEGALVRFLSGGATGGVMGAVKPTLIDAFNRDQELAKLRGDITADQAIELKNAQIGETEAQTIQRLQQPELESLRIEQQRNKERQLQADREADNARADRSVKAAEEGAAERARHNRAMEGRPTGSNERVVQGQIYRKDENGVWRVAPGSPAAQPNATAVRAGEKSAERTAKGAQAAALYKKGAEYWDQAQAKRAEAQTLSTKKFLTDAEKSRLSTLTREAEGLEAKTREVQLKGDGLAAEAEAEPAQPSGGGGRGGQKTFNLRAWKADHPDATPEQIAAKKAQYPNYRFIE